MERIHGRRLSWRLFALDSSKEGDDAMGDSSNRNRNQNEVHDDTKNPLFLEWDDDDSTTLESLLQEFDDGNDEEEELMMLTRIASFNKYDDDDDEDHSGGKVWSGKALLDIFGDDDDDDVVNLGAFGLHDALDIDEDPSTSIYDVEKEAPMLREGVSSGYFAASSAAASSTMMIGTNPNAPENSSNNMTTTTKTTTAAAAAAAAAVGLTARPKIKAGSAAAMENLERALMQGVVPVSANVGSDCLPGDFGFDPLNLASKDYFQSTQQFLLNLLPEPKSTTTTTSSTTTTTRMEREANPNWNDKGTTNNSNIPNPQSRPRALILRDYREAEIRHGRLAMLAAIFWPLQEQLDDLLLDPDQTGPLLYGPITLPYFPLLMTFIMLLLGYMDIYSQSIKDRDDIGEAFLPGDCFWDPLSILEGAPNSMKRNMQERELFNGRVAMIAFVVFLWEEATTHLALANIEGNELLLKPAYQVPYIQEWLDRQFL